MVREILSVDRRGAAAQVGLEAANAADDVVGRGGEIGREAARGQLTCPPHTPAEAELLARLAPQLDALIGRVDGC